MGEGAIQHVASQDQAVAILQNAVASCQRELSALAVDHAEAKRSVGAVIEQRSRLYLDIAKDIQRELDGFKDWFNKRGFLGRLRWLFTGQ